MKQGAIALTIGGLIMSPGCATSPTARATECETSGPCVIEGRLTYSGGIVQGARLELNDGRCLPVVLSGAQIARRNKLDGRPVVVTGRILRRAGEEGIVSAQYEDRWAPVWLCPPGERVLYADTIVWRAGS